MSLLEAQRGSMEPRLDKARHIKYWKRCIKTLLPAQYTGTESNRMYLAFLMVSALDLLGALTTVCTDDERRDYIDWIYRCQHPRGGFRMWPGTDFGERADAENAKWDPANVPATYFALASLLVLGDDFGRVRRVETLRWLQMMQRGDGSFGETLVDGQIEGGRDPRFGYCAAGVRCMLRGPNSRALESNGEQVQDIDIDDLIQCIRQAESFDGGIADGTLHEPHAGYTFCSLGASAFVDRLQTSKTLTNDLHLAPCNPEEVIRWLAYRQTELIDPDASLDSEFIGPSNGIGIPKANESDYEHAYEPLHQSPDKSIVSADVFALSCAGMNGRTNKVADTCYAWWTCASLHIIGQPDLYDREAVLRYLLEKTQHPVLGGFGKFPGDLPDLYHSCLGLAAYSLAGGTDVKRVDPGMCISQEARERLQVIWRQWGIAESDDSTMCDA